MSSVELFSSPEDWCLPVLIAVVLVALNVLRPLLSEGHDGKKKVRDSLYNLAWGFILFIILQWLCQSGMHGLAWVVLLLPFIIMLLTVVLASFAIIKACDKEPELCRRLMKV
jgi:apolipoprotein N-acyltransferase